MEPGDVVVANLAAHTISWYAGSTGEYLGDLVEGGSGGLSGPTGVAYGPDGHLYVSSSGNDRILRYDGGSGAFLDVFAQDSALSRPFSLVFGPDGDLFVSAGVGNRVLRVDGATGIVEGPAAASDELLQPIGLAFGPDGSLFVANSGGKTIDRYDPETGNRLASFGSEHLAFVSDLTFDQEGALLASNASAGTVVRFSPYSGEYLGVLASLPKGVVPMGLAIAADGAVLIGDFAGGRIFRVAPGGTVPEVLAADGMSRPENLAVRPDTRPAS